MSRPQPPRLKFSLYSRPEINHIYQTRSRSEMSINTALFRIHISRSKIVYAPGMNAEWITFIPASN
jgi:hypothetical protein